MQRGLGTEDSHLWYAIGLVSWPNLERSAMKMSGMFAVTLSLASVAGVAGAQSCNGMASGKMSPTMDQDKTFVQTAAQSDFTEITFSKLATQKATNPKVKAYAQKMITDHDTLEAKMKPKADALGVTPPTALDSDHQQKYDALNGMSGSDFDKTYMMDMDADHHKALDAFKTEESTTQDAQLKPIVKQGEKVVAQHTTMADKMVTAMGGTPVSGM